MQIQLINFLDAKMMKLQTNKRKDISAQEFLY